MEYVLNISEIIEGGEFSADSGLISVKIRTGVETIPSKAFEEYKNSLRKITIPNTVKVIEDGTFKDCTALTDIILPKNITKIGSDTFKGCSCLHSISIPDTVNVIGEGAFYGCTVLADIKLQNVKSIGCHAFENCSGLKSITISGKETIIGDSAFKDCTALTNIKLQNVKIIGCGAFDNCSGLQSITIPNSVTTIEIETFKNCSCLAKVDIPNSVTAIGQEAFMNCSGITKVDIPNSVANVGEHAFDGCKGLRNIYVHADKQHPENTKKIIESIKDGNKVTLYVSSEEEKNYYQSIIGLNGIRVEIKNEKHNSSTNTKLNKVSTGIDGLDELLFGGIHLHSKRKNGTVIAIYGPEAVHKLQFSMHLMCGITASLIKENENGSAKPYFYSLSKDNESLNDICLDFQISNAIYNNINDKRNSLNDKSNFNSLNLSELFNDSTLVNNSGIDIEKGLEKGDCYYSPRTHGIHFRKYKYGDDDTNLLRKRKYNMVEEYFPDAHKNPDLGIINAKISGYVNTDNSSETMANFQHMLDDIGKLQEDSNKIPCLVIHGFSIFSSENLKRLPLDYLISTLRKRAQVTILVFDERCKDLPLNADMFIEMRRNDTNYIFHELKICETSYQVAALGWHKFKLRDYGIEVFPSLHRVVQKRYYMSDVDFVANQGMTAISTSEYLTRKCYNEDSLYSLEKLKGKSDNDKSVFLINDYKEASKEHFWEQDSSDDKQKRDKLFRNIILDSSKENSNNKDITKRTRRKITALVGNPNCFKRYFLNARMCYNSCVKKEHTLVILFDKEQLDYRKNLNCPFIDHDKCCNFRNCSDRIHLLCLRTGALPPDELIYKIRQMFKWRFNDSKRITNIVVDDLQKIDYCFPLLKAEALFLPALISICKDNNIGLQLLCDKKSSMAESICALADEVITFERKDNDVDSVTLYIGRSPEIKNESEIHKFTVESPLGIFSCDKTTITLKSKPKPANNTTKWKKINERINDELIGSLRSFWRNGQNVHIAKD